MNKPKQQRDLITITGNICNNIKQKESKNGNNYLQFSLSKSSKNRNDEWESCFIDVMVFGYNDDTQRMIQPKNKIKITGAVSIKPHYKFNEACQVSVFADQIELVRAHQSTGEIPSYDQSQIGLTEEDLPF